MNRITRIKALIMAAATAAASMSVCIPAAQAEDLVLEVPADIVSMYGDVNDDAQIGIADAVQLQRYLLGQSDELGRWRNADIVVDENIDIFDFVKIRKFVTGEEKPNGAKLTIKFVDMMTGEPIDGAKFMLHTLYDYEGEEYSLALGEWAADGEDINFFGLPTDDEYKYLLELLTVPEEYEFYYGGWNCTEFSLGENEEDNELVVRLLKRDAEKPLSIDLLDWTNGENRTGAGLIEITDKDGNPYYPKLADFCDFALPDGEYHANLRLSGMPVSFLDPDGEFADELKEIFPDADFQDCTQGIDFTVKDGQLTEDLRFDLGPTDGMENEVIVSCIDAYTGKPVEGAKLSIIEAPDDYAKVVKTWTSSADGSETITGLTRTCVRKPAYRIQVDSPPEGYTGTGSDNVGFGFVYGYSQEYTYYFTPVTEEKNITVNIYNWDDNCALFNDLCTIDIYNDNGNPFSERIARDIKAGEAFSLPDGDYIASLNILDSYKKGYQGISLMTVTGDEFKAAKPFKGYNSVRTDQISFTVKDGKADKDIDLYVIADNIYGSADTGVLEKMFGDDLDLGGLAGLEGLEDLF